MLTEEQKKLVFRQVSTALNSWSFSRKKPRLEVGKLNSLFSVFQIYLRLCLNLLQIFSFLATLTIVPPLIIYGLFVNHVLLLIVPYLMAVLVWIYFHRGYEVGRLAGFVSVFLAALLLLEARGLLISQDDFFIGMQEFSGLMFLMLLTFVLYILLQGISFVLVLYLSAKWNMRNNQVKLCLVLTWIISILLAFVVPAYFGMVYSAVHPDLDPQGKLGEITTVIMLAVNLISNIFPQLKPKLQS